MEQNSTNTLTFRHISIAAKEAVEYIKQRKNHEIQSLRTRWNKFNKHCMGGIEPNTIYTIVGISGSGKSSFVNTLENDLIDLNPATFSQIHHLKQVLLYLPAIPKPSKY